MNLRNYCEPPKLDGEYGRNIMSSVRHYLDYNATAPLHPHVRDAILAAFEVSGNPSSVHHEGRIARALVENARAQVAALVGAQASDVIFTSSGTEAANLALSPHFLASAGHAFDVLLASAGEHVCVLQGHRFAGAVRYVPLLANGVMDIHALRDLLKELAGQKILFTLQIANNETGVVQPVREAAALVHAAGGVILCDGVQGLGKIPLDMPALGIDALFLSAHKIGGPKGVGALILAAGKIPQVEPLLRGGGQERGLRAGTENVAGLAGFGAAAVVMGEILEVEAVRLAALRDEFERQLVQLSSKATIFGRESERLPNTSAFAVPGLSAQMALMALDLAGVAVSSGSACSSGKVKRSHVLIAMGVDADLADGAVRISFGWQSGMQDVTALIGALAPLVTKALRKRAA